MPADDDRPAPADAEALAEQLRAQQAQFDLAERAARIGYWRMRLADNHVSWSPGMYRLLDVAPDFVPSNEWLLSEIVPEDVKTLTERINTAIRSRSPFYYRSRAARADATAQIVDTHGEVEIGANGRVVSIIGVCQDVTAQVIADERRQQAEEMYRVMTEESTDAVILFDHTRRVQFASKALGRTFGLLPSDLEGPNLLALVHPDDHAEAGKMMVRPQPGETRTATYRFRHAGGHYIWVEAKLRAIYDEKTGDCRNIIVVARDIGLRKAQELEAQAARERAEAANRAKSTFLANMSHELRTPLNAILGFADMMRGEMLGPLGDPRYAEYAALIHSSGELLLDLITDILDMAKIDAGKFRLVYAQVDLSGAAEECVRMLRDRAAASGLALEATAPQGETVLSADRRAVKQIVLNLVSNAIKFTPRGGRIDVETGWRNGFAFLAVRDTGMGIPAEELPRLGRPFEQVCDDAALAKSGTGLGLALVRALAEKHGGAMQIESAVGAGTTVTVTLPVSQPTRSAA